MKYIQPFIDVVAGTAALIVVGALAAGGAFLVLACQTWFWLAVIAITLIVSL